jgi:hypothetical protein
VPDSSIQVNNSFGKIVLKSYDTQLSEGQADLFSNAEPHTEEDAYCVGNEFNELAFLNSGNGGHFDASQLFGASAYPRPLSYQYTSDYSSGSTSSSVTNSLARRAEFSRNQPNNDSKRAASLYTGNRVPLTQSSSQTPALSQTMPPRSTITSFIQNSSRNDSSDDMFARKQQHAQHQTPVQHYLTPAANPSEISDEQSIKLKPFVPSKILIQNATNQEATTTNSNRSSNSSTIKIFTKNGNGASSGDEKKTTNNESSLNSSSTSNQQQQQSPQKVFKSFKQQILSQGAKLVNF